MLLDSGATAGGGKSLGSNASVEVVAGDKLIIETPGGGGYGNP